MDFSLVKSAFETLEITPPSKLVLLEAATLADAHVPPYPPDISVLFTNVNSQTIAIQLKTILLTTYPKEHMIYFVRDGNKKEQTIESISSDDFSENACFYIPAL